MNQKRLVVSLIIGTIALSVISLSASLAWYASSDQLHVNSIDLDLRADEDAGLFISTETDENSFKPKLTNNELNKVKEFEPASSMFQDKWMSTKSETPYLYNFKGQSFMGEPDFNKPSSEGFFQQRLYLLNNIDYYVTIDTEQTFVKSDKDANHLRAQALVGKVGELTVDEIEQKLNKLENCMRFSILVNNPNYYRYYIIDPNKGEDKVTYYAGRLDNDGDEFYDTYQVSVTDTPKEIVYGEIENRDAIKYDNPKSETLSPRKIDPDKKEFFGNAFTGKSDDGAYTYNEQQSLDAGVKYKQEPSISLEEIASDDNPVLIPCYNGVATEIVLSIYLEGWDLDCYNSTMGASFNAQLSFKLLRGII